MEKESCQKRRMVGIKFLRMTHKLLKSSIHLACLSTPISRSSLSQTLHLSHSAKLPGGQACVHDPGQTHGQGRLWVPFGLWTALPWWIPQLPTWLLWEGLLSEWNGPALTLPTSKVTVPREHWGGSCSMKCLNKMLQSALELHFTLQNWVFERHFPFGISTGKDTSNPLWKKAFLKH